MKRYIIDGYNLIHKFPDLKNILNHDLEGARDGLMQKLSSYRQTSKASITVVFDGASSIRQHPSSFSGMKMIFSKYPEKADPLIKRMIDEQHDASLCIVTSDHEIQNYAKLYGVQYVSSQSFISQMYSVSKNDVDEKGDIPVSKEEVDSMMTLFQNAKRGKTNP